MSDNLPHNKEAEENLIGSVLVEGRIFDLVDLPSEAFYIHRWRFVWNAMQALRTKGLDIDATTVMDELKNRKQLDEIGGPGVIPNFILNTPDYENWSSYAEIIRKHYNNRKFIQIANDLANGAYQDKVDVSKIIEQLTSYSKGDRDGRMIGDALDDLEDFILERIANPSDVWGIPTGFKDLDYRGGGLQWERVFLLSGESGTGKTTLALQFCLHAAKNGYGVLIFETEMPEQSTMIRMVELECGLPYRAVMSGRVTEEQMHTWIHTKNYLNRLPIYINDDPAINTADIRRIINKVKVEHFNPELVMLDYLGNLTDEPEYGQADYDQTRAKRFREVIRYTKTAGVAIQDMTKGDSTKLTSISGGAKVRYSADDAYIVKQDEVDPIIHYLVPVKERYGDQVKKVVTLRRPGLGFKDAQVNKIDLNYLG